ncbi:MAG: UDP-N-acetylglucosamine 2-epimerase (non-hydrolyzing) [Candidatus Thermoplasmatota archaeon]|nr:UDP-N-acetylglucosamine 2-epimerase (non-hydrolyzing) [Candidatus Thermoplasmatota archaeon]
MKKKTFESEDLKKKVCVVVGTRPGIIKMSPIIKKAQESEYPSFVIHAGQHYSPSMDDQFFKDLDLKEPEYKLEHIKDCELHGEQTAEMLKGIERILYEERPKVVLVCGDANFNLAGALAARKLHINLGHVESGLRSDDWRMPEEHNRVMIDHISEFLFAPTKNTAQNAIEDNVKGNIFVTGNTIVDAVYENEELAEEKSDILETLGLKKKNYFVLTAHREENVDSKEKLEMISKFIKEMGDKYEGTPIIFPIHPRTKKRLKEFGMKEEFYSIDNLQVLEPLGYIDFLQLMNHAKLVLTDSGGIQEETCILKTPCVTLRENTERPETVEVGSNIVTGLSIEDVLEGVREMLGRKKDWKNPFGDGTASNQIMEVVKDCLEDRLS